MMRRVFTGNRLVMGLCPLHSATRNTLHSVFKMKHPYDTPYKMDQAFDTPYMKFLFEGTDVDYKESVREALRSISPPKERNFTHRGSLKRAQNVAVAHNNVLSQLRALSKKSLINFAEIFSTPKHFLSFYEVLATCDPALALCAADHYTFASLVATHAHPRLREMILDRVDTFQLVGTIMAAEVVAEETPFNTEARWDITEECFHLRGAGKIAVVNAASAEWAVVAATLTVGKLRNQGTQLFFVQLRDRGQLLPGVSIQNIENEGSDILERCGLGVVHFHDVKLSKDQMIQSHQISRMGDVTLTPGAHDTLPLELLKQRQRLATSGIYVGCLKAGLTNLNGFLIHRQTVGPDGARNFPVYGIQNIQTPVVSNLVKSLVYLLGWLQILPEMTDIHSRPSAEVDTQFIGLLHCLQESLIEIQRMSAQMTGFHHVLASSGMRDLEAVVALRKEGRDTSCWIREVAFRSVTMHIGTTHWGWKISGIMSWMPGMLDRMLKNPFYTPRIADLGRHLIFFAQKHHTTRKRLKQSREIEWRKGGGEHQWYDWNTFRHHRVRHCGEAYMEQWLLDVVMKELEKAYDPRGKKIVRDLGWIYALVRQEDNMAFHLQNKMLSHNKSLIAQGHLDNIITVLAPQVVHIIETLCIPEAWRAPCGKEHYWTIPGTDTGIERGEAVVEFKEPNKADSDKKEDHENIVEDPAEHDMLHGLDKKKADTK